ncbi:uncharacterized protein MKK02DRAFT_29333 [Dioszegia hungarica]|uniref:Glycosyl transferase CAP10 domain-containing protein n=1 Tax=Dioszegia hungarica TaxID=4972 RepID=A0AA38HEG7_9TREE|nr:uncharacterized protein MKK02DRAFT_29333 [Dioszegia hungarica]KAI9639228.1 hypothetical protein MKK02DRAFT_29333 [Dioszegia hungarica]
MAHREPQPTAGAGSVPMATSTSTSSSTSTSTSSADQPAAARARHTPQTQSSSQAPVSILTNAYSSPHLHLLSVPEKTHLHPLSDPGLDSPRDIKGSRKRRPSAVWTLPAPLLARLRAEDERRRIWVGLLLLLGAGAVLLIWALRTAGVPVGEGWGLVDDVSGLRGDKSVQLGHFDIALERGGKGPSGKGKGKAQGVAKGSKANNKKKMKWDQPKSKSNDGLLRFNPTDLVDSKAPHPITTLIEEAQTAWKEKNARQSKTLKEATGEYRRRYARAPPKGFEKWWRYVKTHNVPLPDEYDQISADIHSFHPHRPAVISTKQARAAALPDTYVIRNTAGQLSVTKNYDAQRHPGGDQRVAAQLDMVKDVAGDIPDFEAVWSVHDTGRGFVSWSQRGELERAREEGSFLDEEENDEQYGWSALCPFSTDFASALYTDPSPPNPATSKSLISSHPLSYSICAHPSLVPIHGATAGPYRSPITSGHLPLFSYSRHALQSDILGIPYSHLVKIPPTPWEDKTEDRLLWRGGLTGAHYDDKVEWRKGQRFRLLDLHKGGPTSVLTPTGSGAPVQLTETTYSAAAAHYLDVGATGKPIQCDPSTCSLIAKEYTFLPRMEHKEAAAYKYVLDVDGNAWSARFRGLLSTGTVVLKSTIMPEWWTDRAQAWVHYVPIKVDYGDLMDVMAYFTGDLTPSKANGNDTAGRLIAEAGQEWAATHWRQEDMTAYTYRLYLEWARVWSGGDRMGGYVYDEKDEV